MYKHNDILICFKTKRVFKYTGSEIIYRCVLATQKESEIFNKMNVKSITFKEFKKISPESNLRSKERNYGIINIDESLFLLIRNIKQNHEYLKSNNDIIESVLIKYYFDVPKTKKQELEKQSLKKELVIKLKNVLKQLENL
jgi:competence CoiA-like predicted nuclease